jgi:hypothetical protein
MKPAGAMFLNDKKAAGFRPLFTWGRLVGFREAPFLLVFLKRTHCLTYGSGRGVWG